LLLGINYLYLMVLVNYNGRVSLLRAKSLHLELVHLMLDDEHLKFEKLLKLDLERLHQYCFSILELEGQQLLALQKSE